MNGETKQRVSLSSYEVSAIVFEITLKIFRNMVQITFFLWSTKMKKVTCGGQYTMVSRTEI